MSTVSQTASATADGVTQSKVTATSLWHAFTQWLSADNNDTNLYDRSLVFSAFTLMLIGLVIVSSASMPVAERLFGNSMQIMFKHMVFMVLGLVAALVTLQFPMEWWKKYNAFLLLVGLVLLITVLIIGKNVNGSTRWIVLGPINIQSAEPAKLFYFSYLAGYMVRRHGEVIDNLKGFIKPLVVFFILALLLLLQPDLGTVVVMLVATVGLLFLAGAKLWQFFGLMITGTIAVITLIIIEPYRVRRVISFWDPWQDQFGSGYQLTQSLMAYGRGDWFGQGLGNSVQKLEYLPEAHTDFVFAILAEEVGFIGVICVLALLMFLVVKAMLIGKRALETGKAYEGYFAYAIGIWFSFQTAVNVGASAGILPTKGLTLPLVSYGGSSLIIMCIATAVIIRIDHELRMMSLQATSSGVKKRNNKSKKQEDKPLAIVEKTRGKHTDNTEAHQTTATKLNSRKEPELTVMTQESDINFDLPPEPVLDKEAETAKKEEEVSHA
ncbi:cell division protein FtsW [Flocculibacter collagenilyticus]|uniref:cell division protein FtsW n=1 Tax=Flocculibacter collagenilyticus TaxID=2744479 RepID=UPI0018F5EA0F|nr:cell division protein FtsW [Flocculibacter collagenilyticus]